MSGGDPCDDLRDFVASHRRVFVLTGAGCSTASGIPDYRDERGEWKRRPPVMYQAFCYDAATYRRYWARAFAGWHRFAAAEPNAVHHALASWEQAGSLAQLVTQNVDGLHQRAGSRRVIDLHGRLDLVICLGCARQTWRADLQDQMRARNPTWHAAGLAAPDGDADIDASVVETFEPPRCRQCSGLVKPDVVFFGENVPAARYEQARDALDSADALLALGSSLMVFSGFRFVRQAHAARIPIAIVNRGATRGDEFAALKVDGEVGAIMSQVVARGRY